MRLAFVILKRDARRLWWEIAVSLALLAVLTSMDCDRKDFIPGAQEGLFTLLLPFAWSYLAALAVLQEPLAGDRHFWLTRPYPRTSLLAAKALFALAFIHLPSLVADAVVLTAHGFQPLACAGQLFSKQILLAAAITIPSAALAALTRNVVQFLAAAVVLVAGWIVLSGWTGGVAFPWMPVDMVRRALALGALCAVAGAVLALQYARRWTGLSRTSGVAGLLFAGAVFFYVPPDFTSRISCALSGARTAAITIAPAGRPEAQQRPSRFRRPLDPISFAIPISVSGVPDTDRVLFEQLSLELAAPDGRRWEWVRRETARPGRGQLVVGGLGGDGKSQRQMFALAPALYDRLRGQNLTLKGAAKATVYRIRTAGRMPAGGSAAAIPGLGRCSSTIVANPLDNDMLKVLCESPAPLPVLAPVTLVDRVSGRSWRQRLGDSMPGNPPYWLAWLSPLSRRQTFFHIVAKQPAYEGSQWLVPRDTLPNAMLEFEATEVTQCAVISYELRGLSLDQPTVR